jgi:glycosyltransferase involved in cell wall biosynthesis
MISGVIIAKNEEDSIAKAISSLSFCDEIIVIDNDSTDKTAEIAKKNKAIVYHKNTQKDFSSLRNFGLEKAKEEWILFIDADEEVSKTLKDEILQLLEKDKSIQGDFSGYFIKRKDYWWGKEIRHGEAGNIKLLRLIRRGMGKWSGNVHEVLETHGEIGTLNEPLIHRPHQTVAEFIDHINAYSSIRAEELDGEHVKSTIFQIVVYPLGKFIVNYFIRLGFLDGAPGFGYAFLMSFYTFLVRSKLFQLQDKT